MSEKKLSSIVPDLYYDLIARVVPGAAFLTVLCSQSTMFRSLTREVVTQFSAAAVTSTMFAVVGAGYLLSLVSSVFGEMVRLLFFPTIWMFISVAYRRELDVVNEEMGLGVKDGWWVSPLRLDVIYRKLHVFIRRSENARTVVLSKMQAEAAACTNLLAMSLLLLIATLVRNFLPTAATAYLSQTGVITIAWLGALICLFAALNRWYRLIERHIVMFEPSFTRTDAMTAALAAPPNTIAATAGVN